MYIPYLASALLKVKDTLLPTGTINFQGMLIGNGVMLTELNWRRKAIDTFYSRHYFYGPEITQLLANCKYTADDLLTSSCIIGKKLADQVRFE